MALARMLRRHFRFLYIAAFAACLTLGANAWGQLRGAAEVHTPPLSPLEPVVQPLSAATPAVDKDGTGLAQRNMFCSSCDNGQTEEPERPVVASELPLELIATNVANREELSFATIRHTNGGGVGAYYPGDEIPSIGTIADIQGPYVLIRSAHTEGLERLTFAPQTPKAQATARQPRTSTSAKKSLTPGTSELFEHGISKVDNTHYEVDRQLIQKVIGNPALGGRFRAIPTQQGVKMQGLRNGSPLTKLGLQNGDTLASVNGMELTDPDKLLAAFGALRSSPELSLTVMRGGKPVRLQYAIR